MVVVGGPIPCCSPSRRKNSVAGTSSLSAADANVCLQPQSKILREGAVRQNGTITQFLTRKNFSFSAPCADSRLKKPLSALAFLVVMGLRPTEKDENHVPPHPRERGGPGSVRNTMDSCLHGNDAIFEKVVIGLCPTRTNGNPFVAPRSTGTPRRAAAMAGGGNFRGSAARHLVLKTAAV